MEEYLKKISEATMAEHLLPIAMDALIDAKLTDQQKLDLRLAFYTKGTELIKYKFNFQL